ncbi:polysaccharide lyase family 7 protein [Streptomyces phaeochromogenes]|nr:polysaccharide lyase family 7 protein [Streptomyces phaeochromogenes]
MIIATLFVPVASIIIPQFVLVERLGLLNTQAGVILSMSGAAGALYVLLFIGFCSGVPTDLFDAAKLDGAGLLRTFRLVLPLAKPVIAVVVLFQFITNWNVWATTGPWGVLGVPSRRDIAVHHLVQHPHYKLGTSNYQLGTRFQGKVVAHDGKVDVYCNGALKATVDGAFGSGYCKAGAYTQANCNNSSPCDTSNYGQVALYGVTVTHK